jgi:zinc transport system substrate-binding protein
MAIKKRRCRRRPRLLCLLVILVAGLLSGPPGSGRAGSEAEKIPVVASILPLGDFCRQIGGNRVSVQVLIPPGASPHVFEPPPSVVAKAMAARLFVYVGAGLDPWAERLRKNFRTPNLKVVEAVQGLALIGQAHQQVNQTPHRHRATAGSRGQGADPEAEHTHLQGNPHVWLDPVLVQDICRRLAAVLISLDPEHRQVYESNLDRFRHELEVLHQDIQTRVGQFTLRQYVCFHPAFTYFARRYQIQEVGVIEAAPGREPSPRQIKKILDAIRTYKVRVVFAEPQFSPRLAEVIAREAGAAVLLLDPLGGSPPYGADYISLMRHNLSVLEQAMR